MNPFTLNYNPDYFCDRELEQETLYKNLLNGRNTLIHSPRRLGKSALIKHLFNSLEKQNQAETIFIDLFATQNMEGLIRVFAEKLLAKYYMKNLLAGIKQMLKGISPNLSFSPDGTPSLSLSINETQQGSTLMELFQYLEKRKKKVIVALDEFQVISSYPEKAEAFLRTYIQSLNNVQFIFSGSSNHLLQEMFFSAKRPFYQSVEVVILDKINRDVYRSFIETQFNLFNKKVSEDAVNHLLDFTDTYTYYTQAICNQAFAKTTDELTIEDAIQVTELYIETRKEDYQNLLRLLPENQKKVAVAIAKEELVSKPSSIDFIIKNKLPSVSSTLLALKALKSKEIIYRTNEGYIIYDVFFKRFLQKYF
jgi:AAA+ ATPase superfamily predicted ATPase